MLVTANGGISLSGFADKHWIIGGIVASLLWVAAGWQFFSHRERKSAIEWVSVGIVIIAIMCGWAAAEREYVGLLCGIAVLCLEAWLLMRVIRREKRPQA